MNKRSIAGLLSFTSLIILVVVAGLVSTLNAEAMSNGAPQLQCVQCHTDAANNPADFTVEGIPETYEPGKEYEITVKITKGPDCSQGVACGGFAVEVTGGELEVIDEKNTFIATTATGEKLLTHTKEGSMLREWKFKWKAPETPTEVTFKIAVIAANGDGSFNGDAYGYKEVTVKPAAAGPQVVTITETITKTTYIRTPTATVIEYDAGFAAGVAAAIFIIVVLAYIFIARR